MKLKRWQEISIMKIFLSVYALSREIILIAINEVWYGKRRIITRPLIYSTLFVAGFYMLSNLFMNAVEHRVQESNSDMMIRLTTELDILYGELNSLSSANMRQDSVYFQLQSEIMRIRGEILKVARNSRAVKASISNKYPEISQLKFKGPDRVVEFLKSRLKYIKSDDVSPELRLIQAAIESDWGRSDLSKKHHNDFGQKWHVVERWKPEWIREGRVYKVYYDDDCHDKKCTFIGFKYPGDSWILNEIHLKGGYGLHKVPGKGIKRAEKSAEKLTKYATGSGYVRKLQRGAKNYIIS